MATLIIKIPDRLMEHLQQTGKPFQQTILQALLNYLDLPPEACENSQRQLLDRIQQRRSQRLALHGNIDSTTLLREDRDR